MTIKDILLTLISYPDPSPASAIERAVSFAAAVDSQITAVTFEADVKLTRSSNLLANVLLDIPQMLSDERFRSAANARSLLENFTATADRFGVRHHEIILPYIAFQVPDVLVDHARIRDLTIVPQQTDDGFSQWYAEAVVFESGRATMILPAAAKKERSLSALNTVTVAWDFSRAAARALSDALPILKKAKTVRLVSVKNEKDIAATTTHDQLVAHLSYHGIKGVVDIIDANKRSIGDALSDYVESSGSDLLVMGAYGHSRVREVILGGATMSMLTHPPIPILLSH